MAMVINSNIQSLNAQRHLNSSLSAQNTATERLSSGLRINSAADDAAGLAIANRMTSQVKGLDMAIRNANDGVSMIQTAEGALSETTNILQRMRELSIQSANGIYDTGNRGTLNAEVQQLKAEIDRIAETTTFNGLNILDGSLGKVGLQIGEKANQTIDLDIQAVDTKTLGMGSTSVDVLGGATDLAFFDGSTAGDDLAYNDVLINGQSIVKLGEVFDMDNTLATDPNHTQQVLLDRINANVNGVTATTQVSNSAGKVGDGVLSGADSVTLEVSDLNGDTTTIVVADTESLQELSDKINDLSNGLINSSISDDGKLVLQAENLASIKVTDTTSPGGSIGDVSVATGFIATTTTKDTLANASIALTSDNGDPITIERGNSGTLEDLAKLGFRETNTAGTVEGLTVDGNAFAKGDMTINGVDVGKSDSAELDDKIAAINEISGDTGVTATAFSSLSIQGFTEVATQATGAAGVFLNGVAMAVTAAGPTTDFKGSLVNDINAITKDTGITAFVKGDNVVLEGDVSSISIKGVLAGTFVGTETTLSATDEAAGSAATTLAVGAGLGPDVKGGIRLTSETGNPISVTHKDAAAQAKTGLLDSNSSADGKFGAAVNSLDISTAAGANKAIDILDVAIQTVSDVRGDLGAVTNRLNYTVSNLSNVSENASAAKSRIMDADFAAESANLSRAQVLQQAGNAMLAQANSRPQQVLSLLQ